MDTKNPFDQPDTKKFPFGELLLCILIAPIILLTSIIIPLYASTLKTTREMETGIVLLSLFTLVLAVCLFKAARR